MPRFCGRPSLKRKRGFVTASLAYVSGLDRTFRLRLGENHPENMAIPVMPR